MVAQNNEKSRSAVFITFPGNCKKALTFYQSCFGGILHFEPFEEELEAYKEIVVSGTLLADSITIYGSDLVHNEGRKLGNYISIFLACKNTADRKQLIEKLAADKKNLFKENQEGQKLIELTDVFDVRWVLGLDDLKF
ncbi:glyoxalase [Aequorivita soesokkakensis]|uniref:Glyoxalase n=1 Tax=Aequorivita soesokkakensis TaxID=1385699 RepID=A0A1A9LHG8_9FLAO|nr:glyoxalase [Aequorivita soesokkakensis]OAD92324.1 glyoxalase [Aequorivita soesokkakensis]